MFKPANVLPNQENKYLSYTCGWCKMEQFYLPGEEAPIPCPECGYIHKDRDPNDVPPNVPVDLGQY